MKRALRAIIKLIDRILRRLGGLWEFSDDPDCICRASLTCNPHPVTLTDGTEIPAGELIGLIHLWNERMPPLPEGGADLAWAITLRRQLARSLQLLADYIPTDPRLAQVRFFGGDLALPWADSSGAAHFLSRLGFDLPEPTPVRTGPLRRLWARVQFGWIWALRWAFNPESVRGRTLDNFSHRPVWITTERLLQKHGTQGGK